MKSVLILCMVLFSLFVVHGSLVNHDSVRGGRYRGIGDSRAIIFNVLKFGAKPDGKKDSTQAFMKAWDVACQCREEAMLVIPDGRFLVGQVTFAGPCNNPTPIIVLLKGTVLAETHISKYPSPEWFTFERITGLILTGGGIFDGQGASTWEYNDCHKNSNCQLLPTSIKFNSVKHGSVRRINSINSKSFHISINNCEDLRFQGLQITAPGKSPNTDGIHISKSTDIRISKTIIGTGDDCVSIGQGSMNITISRVTCGPGHGISVGSLGKYPDEKDVRGVIVKNCTLMNTENGIRIKTWPGSPPSQASGFIFQDIIMKNVENPIIIDQQYCPVSCKNQPSRVKVSNVHYRNIRGTSASKIAVRLMCSPNVPCQNVRLFDINLKYGGSNMDSFGSATGSSCSNVKAGFGGVQIPPPCR